MSSGVDFAEPDCKVRVQIMLPFIKGDDFRGMDILEIWVQIQVKILRTDNGEVCKNRCLEDFLNKLDIIHQTFVEYTPKHGGTARANRTMKRARCIMYEANLPKSF